MRGKVKRKEKMAKRGAAFKKGDKVVGKADAGIFKGVRGIITSIASSPEGQYGDIRTNTGANLAVWFKNFKMDNATKRKVRKVSSPSGVKYGW